MARSGKKTSSRKPDPTRHPQEPRAPRGWFSAPASALTALALLLYLLIGLRLAGDYGISWDEPAMREVGAYAIDYIRTFDRRAEFLPPETASKFHPVSFELVYRLAATALGVRDVADEYRLRHRMTFLAFFAAVAAFQRVAARYLGSALLAAAATASLVCEPRIFAESFYNPKDIPFLVTYVVGMLTMLKWLERGSMGWALVHALACAVAISTRPAGLLLPAVTLLAGVSQVVLSDQSRRARAWSLALFAGAVGPLTVACWPVLWRSPVEELLAGITYLNRFPFIYPVLFNGQMMNAEDLPWYYVPEWIAITTPVAILGVLAVGVVFLLWRIGSQRLARPALILDVAMLLLAAVPPLVVMASHAVIYDGWRHLFFIFPPLLLVGFKGSSELVGAIRWPRARGYVSAAAGAAVALNLLLTVSFMSGAHPHENVYFNRFAGRNLSDIRRRFELDYWGLVYRQALEHVLRVDERPVLNVAVANPPGMFNADILPAADRARIRYTQDLAAADYFVSNYRWHPEEYEFGAAFYQIEVDGGAIVTVRKMR